MSRGASVAEQQIHKKLVNSNKFKNVVHTVHSKGVRKGAKKVLEDSAPGASMFGSLFLDELKLGIFGEHPDDLKEQQKYLPKQRKGKDKH